MPPTLGEGLQNGSNSMDVSPDGRLLAVSGPDRVYFVETTTGQVRSFATGVGGGHWLAFDPGGKSIAVNGDPGVGIFTLVGSVVHREDNVTGLSPTGYENAAWLSDSSGIFLESPWYGFAWLSTDPAAVLQAIAGAETAGRQVRDPTRNRFAHVVRGGIAIWDTSSNTSMNTQLPIDDAIQVGDLEALPDGTLYVASRVGMLIARTEPPFSIEGPFEELRANSIDVSANAKRLVLQQGTKIASADQHVVAAEPIVDNSGLSALSPDGSRLYVETTHGAVYSVSLSALDETAEELTARIAGHVGIGQPDLTIQPFTLAPAP